MSKVPDFHSVHEVKKPANKRVYHDKDTCPSGREIPAIDRRSGKSSYRHCEDCSKHS